MTKSKTFGIYLAEIAYDNCWITNTKTKETGSLAAAEIAGMVGDETISAVVTNQIAAWAEKQGY